ncbi:MAG: hypothetical protein II644_02490 [Paludibacteraceae bacterium]|nr:hypothetical protein [Paludibacteraceae bacterium]
MKKIFSLFAAVLFASSMMAAVGNLYYTFATAYNSSNTSYANVYDVTISGMDWSVPGNQKQEGFVRIGGKNIDGVDRIITAKTAMGDAIAKIELNHKGLSSAAFVVNSISVVTATDANFTTGLDTVKLNAPSLSKQTAGTLEFLPKNEKWNSGVYYKFLFNVTNTNTSSNYGFDVASIKFYSFQDANAAAISASNVELGIVATTSLPLDSTINVEVTGSNLEGAITYEPSANLVVTGALTAAGGTLNVTLNAAAEGEYDETIVLSSGTTQQTVHVTATIVNTVGDGTKNSPFTVADVVKLNNQIGMEKYWVVGYIVGCATNSGLVAESNVATNIALGDAADQTEDVVPVELPSGDIRTALNIVDNASNLGQKVKVHGQLIAYFSFKGVKALDDYEFVTDVPDAIDNTVVEGKAVKRIVNGQLVIEKNGVIYNAQGAMVR